VTDDKGFLKAIQEAPDDDTTRLVYADWLEERDDLRGEYLRLHVQTVAAIRRLAELQAAIDPAWTLMATCGLVALLSQPVKMLWSQVRAGMVLITPDGRIAEVIAHRVITPGSLPPKAWVRLRNTTTGVIGQEERYHPEDSVEVLRLLVGG
jgi:uncharacterized protein (TIGR02996 family)